MAVTVRSDPQLAVSDPDMSHSSTQNPTPKPKSSAPRKRGVLYANFWVGISLKRMKKVAAPTKLSISQKKEKRVEGNFNKGDADTKYVHVQEPTSWILSESLKKLIPYHDEKPDFDKMYPYLAGALEMEGRKTMFMKKWHSIEPKKLEEMEAGFKGVEKMRFKTRVHALRVIDKVYETLLSD